MPNASIPPKETDLKNPDIDSSAPSVIQDKTWSLRMKLGLTVLVLGGVAGGAALFFVVTGPPRNYPPKLSDFTPPYTCPTSLAPRSCTTPIKVVVECVDLRTIDPRNLTRPLTETEISNAEKACELLPLWLDQDPRIEIVGDGQYFDFGLKYRISSSGRSFTSTHVFVEDTNFGVVKPFQQPHDTAAYFVEQSILELGNRGYLP